MKEHSIDTLKAALLMGVLLIHSNISCYPGVGPDAGAVVGFVSVVMCSVCVPGFFLISGMLFFRGVDVFDVEVYKRKLRSRVKTLLVPYLLWNLIAAATDVFKGLVAAIPTPGFVEDGQIHWSALLLGCWSTGDGYPLAFAFWFIRNLMVFVLLTPVAWVVARRSLLFALVLSLLVIFGWGWGFSYFLIGAFISIRKLKVPLLKPIGIAVAMAVYLLGCVVKSRYSGVDFPFDIYGLLKLVMTLAALLGGYSLMKMTQQWMDRRRLARKVIGSAFFIYAFHQLFCTLNCRFWVWVCPPPEGSLNITITLLDYSFVFLTFVGLSLCVAFVLRRLMPRTYSVLTGGRSV